MDETTTSKMDEATSSKMSETTSSTMSETTSSRMDQTTSQIQSPVPKKSEFSLLNTFENSIYFFIWTSGVLYALWQFVQAAATLDLDPNDFQDGFSFLNRKKDSSDIELVTLKNTFLQHWNWLGTQFIATQIFLSKKLEVLLLFYAVFPIIALVDIIGVINTLIYITYVLLMFVVHTQGKKIFCYGLTIITLLLITNQSTWIGKDDTGSFLYEVGLAWLAAKCLSWSIDRIDHGTYNLTDKGNIFLVLAYSFYLPTFFTGPILTFRIFAEQITGNRSWSTLIFIRGCVQLVYYLVIYFVLEFFLHYLYSSAVQYYPEEISNFNAWSLCGLGYCLPLLFYLKYFVIYGLAGSFATLERLKFPPPPKCVSCIHLSSILWRHFDRGLYLWILRYLYLPLVNGNWSFVRKFFALLPCFTFVCIWHGLDKAICMWSVLNFILVVSELIASKFASSIWGKWLKDNISDSCYKSFVAIFATPHFMLMCTSSTFFLANWDIGMLIFKNIIFGGWKRFLVTGFIMYCGCRTSMYFKYLHS